MLSLIFTAGQSTSLFSVIIKVIQLIVLIFFILSKNLYIRNYSIFFFVLFTLIYLNKILFTGVVLDHNGYLKPVIRYVLDYLFFVFFPYLFTSSIDLKQFKDVVINSFIYSGSLLALVTLFFYWELLFSGNLVRLDQIKYYNQVSINPILLSYSSSVTLCLLLYRLKNITNKIIKISSIIILVICIVTFLLGSTRSSFIALILSLSFLFIRSNSKIYSLIFVTIASPLLILIYNIGDFSLFERLSFSINDLGSNDRFPLWHMAINEFLEFPILGGLIEVGNNWPHNILIEILMSTGLVGFIVFFLFVLSHRFSSTIKENSWLNILLIHALIWHLFSGSIYTSSLLFISLGFIDKLRFKKSPMINNI